MVSQFKLLLLLVILFQSFLSIGQTEPLKVGIIGLSHSHVHGLLGRPQQNDIEIVGIVEPNLDLAKRYSEIYKYPMKMVFPDMESMIAAKHPEAVAAFGSIYEHLKVVETCAPKGIHIMVEKPLAVSVEHAEKMQHLAQKHKVQLLTNYETTWYPTNHKAYEMVDKGILGPLRKVVVHDGHQGPKEIGVNQEFLDWLTDPVLNGGGALTDFGCYGANLITWLQKGERPIAVTAITQTNKPDVYPKVDDEASILLKYPKMQGIIQASWNWPFSRKDMEIYGVSGLVFSENSTDLSYRLNENEDRIHKSLEPRQYPFNDPFSLFHAIVKKGLKLPKFSLSSLENNMIVVEILEAAKKSAASGKTIQLKPLQKN